MKKINKVFIATSLDGYIADAQGSIDWLHATPNPDQIDMGYAVFMDGVDALLMGRSTFETVCGFDIEWPYDKPVYVWSSTLEKIPEAYADNVSLVRGTVEEAMESIYADKHNKVYVDGGRTIQSFLKADCIDEMIITTIPVMLGRGVKLFGEMPNRLRFSCVETQLFLDSVVQNKYVRQRD